MLYDTYAFSLDLTQLIASNSGCKVDTAVFEEETEKRPAGAHSAQKKAEICRSSDRANQTPLIGSDASKALNISGKILDVNLNIGPFPRFSLYRAVHLDIGPFLLFRVPKPFIWISAPSPLQPASSGRHRSHLFAGVLTPAPPAQEPMSTRMPHNSFLETRMPQTAETRPS